MFGGARIVCGVLQKGGGRPCTRPLTLDNDTLPFVRPILRGRIVDMSAVSNASVFNASVTVPEPIPPHIRNAHVWESTTKRHSDVLCPGSQWGSIRVWHLSVTARFVPSLMEPKKAQAGVVRKILLTSKRGDHSEIDEA